MEPLLIEIFRLAVWLVILVAVFVPLEHAFAVRPLRPWRAQTGIDLCWYFINALVWAAVVAVPLATLSRALHGADWFGWYGIVSAWPLWLKLPVALVVNDIGAYWVHRWMHHSPFLWRFHAVHHSAEHLDWLVNTRAHPVDIVLMRLGGVVPVYLLGLGFSPSGKPEIGVALVTIVGTLWSFFIHSNVRWRLGAVEWLVATPAFHHWHHSNDERRDRNYAAVFPWIDRLFGTHDIPPVHPTAYGIDGAMSPTLAGQFVDPFVAALRSRRARREQGGRRFDEEEALPID
ncbi:MAG: sterol desaturase family protein [Planctomycetes bacterium]|nr:sterol desaturase family protein [Planctomycetota bacterium]